MAGVRRIPVTKVNDWQLCGCSPAESANPTFKRGNSANRPHGVAAWLPSADMSLATSSFTLAAVDSNHHSGLAAWQVIHEMSTS